MELFVAGNLLSDCAIIKNIFPCCSDSASKSGDYSLVTDSGSPKSAPAAVTGFCGRDYAIINNFSPCCSDSASKSGDYSLVTDSGSPKPAPMAVTGFCGRDSAIINNLFPCCLDLALQISAHYTKGCSKVFNCCIYFKVSYTNFMN